MPPVILPTDLAPRRSHHRQYVNARNLREEAKQKLDSYDAIMGTVREEYERLRETGIPCQAFAKDGNEIETLVVTRQCWNHVFIRDL